MITVILAGGSGTRLWPRSRSHVPKHLLNLTSKKTLIEETVDRVLPISREIVVVTEVSHARQVKTLLKKYKKTKVIVEPGRRGTASAIALALAGLHGQADEVVAVLHSDHLIKKAQKFQQILRTAEKVAQRDRKIVLLGITPSYPATSFGYIKRDGRIGKSDSVYKVAKFVEKPDEQVARKYIKTGNFFWNAGMFVARVDTFLGEYAAYLPTHSAAIKKLAKLGPASKQLYLSLPNETIDYGILEKSSHVAVIPADIGWTDIGSWSDLHDVLSVGNEGNVFDGQFVDIDSKNCLVYSRTHLVATVGLENMVVVVTDDVVLVTPKERAQDVKKLVENLKATKREQYL